MARKTPKTWKKIELDVARKFGAERNIGSGSLGRSDRSCSDSTHERLYIETKYGDPSRWFNKELRKVLREDKIKAEKENKIFVIALKEKGQSGFLVLVHVDDLKDVVNEIVDKKELI